MLYWGIYEACRGKICIGQIKKVLFIPYIDKWNRNIIDEISSVDYAFIDGTFNDNAEIDNGDISEIPHPFIIESLSNFKDLPWKKGVKYILYILTILIHC